jgi:hypothetical protein
VRDQFVIAVVHSAGLDRVSCAVCPFGAPSVGSVVFVDCAAQPPATGSARPGRGDQDRLEVHDERASVVVDRRPGGVEQTVSKVRLEGRVVAV